MYKSIESELKKYGIKVQDSKGNLKSMEQLLKEIEREKELRATSGYDFWLD